MLEQPEKSFADAELALPERRGEPVVELFPNDREPTAEELGQSLRKHDVPRDNFFSDRGPLFTACWWINRFVSDAGGDITKIPKDQLSEDLKDRIRIFSDKMRREKDVDLIIEKARAWYGRYQAGRKS